MSDASEHETGLGALPPEPTETTVPDGNLFAAPKMTALDPVDKRERKDVERLLESLERP